MLGGSNFKPVDDNNNRQEQNHSSRAAKSITLYEQTTLA